MPKKVDLIEECKLKWPDGCERTRIKERKPQHSWKKSWGQYRDMLASELDKMEATSIFVCRSEGDRLDPGVSVWWSMKKEDFSWQQGLGLETLRRRWPRSTRHSANRQGRPTPTPQVAATGNV